VLAASGNTPRKTGGTPIKYMDFCALIVESVYGSSQYPFNRQFGPVSVSIEPSGNFSLYRRVQPGRTVEKVIGNREGTVVVNPVEPVHLPGEVTGMLELHFTPISLEPESSCKIYLKFPVEIGVFLQGRGDGFDVLDIFSLARPRFSLYGTPERGLITRHADTRVYDQVPATDPLEEGVMALSVKNSSRSWVEVSRAVFDHRNMHLYHGEMVAMTAQMEVFSREVAETRILARAPAEGMQASVRLFSAGKSFIPEIPLFLMEYGVGE